MPEYYVLDMENVREPEIKTLVVKLLENVFVTHSGEGNYAINVQKIIF
jgi:hypothetical protein